MLLSLPQILTADEIAEARRILASAGWVDGRVTAGHQSSLVKNNQQLPEDSPQAQSLGRLVQQALARSADFSSAVLPAKIFPPLFNRYGDGMGFGDHIDNSIRAHRGGVVRTDVSATLFLADPAEYDGGERVIEDTYGSHSVKLNAGDLIIYPATSVHRVLSVTRGARVASFFWVQSHPRRCQTHAAARPRSLTRPPAPTRPRRGTGTGDAHWDLSQPPQAMGGGLNGVPLIGVRRCSVVLCEPIIG